MFENLFRNKEYSSVQRSYLKTGKVMETAVLIGKVIESYNCEHFIKLFIELAQFTHEIFVDFDLCCSDCDLVDFLVGACLCINMLGKNVDKKIFVFLTVFTLIEKFYQ